MISVALLAFVLTPLPPQPPAKTISGRCTFGEVTQVGKNVTITGNPSWTAVGRITPGGLLQVTWTNVPSGKTALAVYVIEDERFAGHWAWSDDAEFSDEDICSESLMSEVIGRTRE